MMRAGYTVTTDQHRWLRRRAVDEGTDASAVLRDLLDRAMTPSGDSAAPQEGAAGR